MHQVAQGDDRSIQDSQTRAGASDEVPCLTQDHCVPRGPGLAPLSLEASCCLQLAEACPEVPFHPEALPPVLPSLSGVLP